MLNNVDLVRINKEDPKVIMTNVVDGLEDDLSSLDQIDNILDLDEEQFPRFTLAKIKARFLLMLSWYKNK